MSRLSLVAASLAALLALASCGTDGGSATRPASKFDAERAFAGLRAEVRLGPRPAGSAANRRDGRLIARRLRDSGVQDVRIQHPWRNVVGRIPGSQPGTVVVGAHRDTKDIPGFVGANDGASGVAVLLELARDLPNPVPGPSVDLAFFDAEESRGAASSARAFERTGDRGSRQYVRYAAAGGRQGSPPLRSIRAMVLFDMVGDCDLRIPLERSSEPGPLPGSSRHAAKVSERPFRGRRLRDPRRPHAVPARGDPGGRPDRLRLRSGPAPGRLLAHAQATTSATSARAACAPSARPPSPQFRRSGSAETQRARGYPLTMPATAASAPRRVLLASPRGYCAGVDRAVQTVEQALDLHGPPVYVRKEIVHNKHVVQQLAARGAIFVEEETEVPEGELVVFSAARGRPERSRERRRARPAHDRRDLPARHEGPRRGPEVRRAGLHDRPHRPRGPRGGRGNHGRGAQEHPARADRRRRGRARGRRPGARRLHNPDHPFGRRDDRDHRAAQGALSRDRRARSPTTSATRPPTARSPSSSSPASATSCW